LPSFTPHDPDYEERVRKSFDRQKFMQLIGARLVTVEPGFCEIHLPYRDDLAQHHGYFHAGVIGTIADNAGGFAAFSLMPPGTTVLTVEYKLNLLSPGDGELLKARGQVTKPGRTLTVCRTEVFAEKDGARKLCATSLMTLIAAVGRNEVE
jgi:uncharacterized protein (TIGR00369 family)